MIDKYLEKIFECNNKLDLVNTDVPLLIFIGFTFFFRDHHDFGRKIVKSK